MVFENVKCYYDFKSVYQNLTNIDLKTLLTKENLMLYSDQALLTIHNYYESNSIIGVIKDTLFYYLIYKILRFLFLEIYGYGLFRSICNLYNLAISKGSKILLNSPIAKSKVDKELNQTKKGMEDSLIKTAPNVKFDSLPLKGLTADEVLSNLDTLHEMNHSNWEDGKVSGAVYHGGSKLIDFQTQALGRFAVANQLHPDAFPGVRQMEAEVVSMVLKLFNSPESGCGTTTSGGTESLLLACLSAREKGRAEKCITEPEIVAPKTIHAAVFKASKYFGMKLRLADLGDDYKVDINHVKRLVTKNTVLILGSAPNFPHGIVDDIEALSKIAIKRNIPLHVDCCLGSFIVAYYSKALNATDLPPFDFRVPGVTSISCDTHKYGFAPKGSSVIMYRDPRIRRYQYYVTSNWLGGLYGSPTLAGSRPGALTVGTWATMVHIGDEGYTKSCFDIVTAARRLKAAVSKIPSLELIGDPVLSVVAFKSDKLNIHKLGDILSKNSGWHLSALQNPPALHLALTRLSVPAIDDLILNLKESVKELLAQDEDVKSDTAQLYGAANSIAMGSLVDEVITTFLDCMYQTDKSGYDGDSEK